MKFVWLLLFLLIPIPIEAQDLLPELVRRIKPSAVAIETFDARGEKLSREQTAQLFREVQATKAARAQQLLLKRTQPKER